TEPREGPQLGRMKPQDDVLARNPGGHQLFGDRARRAVVLDPDLAAVDVDMHDGPVHAAHAVPADVHDFVVVPFGVHDGLRLDLPVPGFVPGIVLDEAAHDLTIAF